MQALSVSVALAVALAAHAVPQRRRHAPHRTPRHVAATKKKMNAIARGTWGGPHIEIEITDAGATVQYDCAHGSIREPLLADASGRFSARGVHVPEHGGPTRPGQQEHEMPARYEGRFEGRTMTLNVTLTDSGESAGAFTLTQGQPGRLTRCR